MTQNARGAEERLVQTERLPRGRTGAASAHELRNPSFPMQITVENLQKHAKLRRQAILEVSTNRRNFESGTANLNTID